MITRSTLAIRAAGAVLLAVTLLATAAPAQTQAAAPALGLFKIRSAVIARCLDVAHGSLAHAAPVVSAYCSGGTNQKWRLLAAKLPGYWEIRALHSNKCLDVAHRSLADRTPIIQGTCWGGANQTWNIVHAGNDLYELRARHSNSCIAPDALAHAAAIGQYRCNAYGGFALRFWRLYPTTP